MNTRKMKKSSIDPTSIKNQALNINNILYRWRTIKMQKKRKRSKELLNATKNAQTQSTYQNANTPSPDESFTEVDTSWNIESYRRTSDTKSLWNLKKWFMELYKDILPENELVPLAKSFAYAEALGCSYAPELMDRLRQLGEPIAKVYRNLKSTKCTRTVISVENATRLHQRRASYSQHMENVRQWQIEDLQPIFPAYTLPEMFQNIVLVNNSLKETTEWFERLGCGTISLVMQQTEFGLFEVKAFVNNCVITKTIGQYEKAHSQCVADFIEILKNYCYQVNFIRRFPFPYYNVEKLFNETDMEESERISENNIGYQMLQKLGWNGGPLGNSQTGIVDPIELHVKHDRRGLGCTQPAKRTRSSKVFEPRCAMDVAFYDDLMQTVLTRKPYYDLIFSPTFTETERIILTKMAAQRQTRCETRQSGSGQAQFVIKRYPLPPHEVLIQVLVEKNPVVQKFYEVVPPKLGLIPK